jgi:tRNA threonylcarbamoyladenosine biosynthesis protein TsaB
MAPPRLRLQRASGVAQAAEQLLQSGNVMPAAELVPNYLRLSQAERERLARENG